MVRGLGWFIVGWAVVLSVGACEEGRTKESASTRPGSAAPVVAATQVSVPAPATGATTRCLEGFEERRGMMLEAVWGSYQAGLPKVSSTMAFWNAEAMFRMGKIEEGRKLVNRGLDLLVPGNKENRWIHGGNSGFTAWPGIDCYIRCNQFLDEGLKERYRTIYSGAVVYRRLSTSNHKIMAAVTRYLATQVWGEEAFKPDAFFPAEDAKGSYFSEKDRSGEKYVRQIIDETLKWGPGEYASRPYGAENILPLLSIAECARDPELRQRAMLAYEVSLMELAPAYLGGHLATFSTRSYPDMEVQRPWGVATLLWVYFGGIAPERLQGQWAMRAALGDYRMPAVLMPAGTDRSAAYVYRNRVNKWALSHYVNRSYVIFSRSPKAERPTFIGQNYPCGVMWEEPDVNKCSQFWLTNPAADGAEGNNQPTGIHTHGATNYEQQVQHKGAYLSVFNIKEGFRNPYVLGFVPGGYLAAINESKTTGRIFLHYRSVLIAVASAKEFEWDAGAGIKFPAGATRAGDSEFRVMARHAAVGVETARPGDFEGETAEARLGAFRAAIVGKSKIELKEGERPAGVYVDREGNVLECAFDGEDKVNGEVVDWANWPVLENPWMEQRLGGTLTVTDGKRVRVYDFSKYEVRESLKR